MPKLRLPSIARWLTVIAAILFLPTTSSAQMVSAKSASAEHLKVELLSDTTSVNRRGQTFHLGLHFQLDPGWHIYWVNAGDSGLPTTVQWKLPAFLPESSIG
ncbi:MAG TPA: hypothetical protein VMU62_10075, partial [Acidobacteriaceae bacterium]|nr:hypothetical protein [Acidobacteriaceae bacterium]